MKKPDYLSNNSKYQWTPGEDMHQIKGEYGAITQAVNNVKGDTVDKAVKIILNNPFTSKDFFEALNIGNKAQAGTVAQYEIMLNGKKVRAQFIKQDNGNWRINPSFKTDFVYPEDKDLKIIQKTKDGERIFYIDNEEIKVLSVKFIEKPKTPELKIVSQSNSENPKVNEKPSAEEESQDIITQSSTPLIEIKNPETNTQDLGNKQKNDNATGSIDDGEDMDNLDWDLDLDWEVESSQKSKAPAQKEAGEAPMQEDDIQAPEDNDGMEDLKSQEKSGKTQEREGTQTPEGINSTENPKSQENIRSLAGLNAEQIAKIANAGNFNPEEYKKQPLHVNTRFTNFYDSAKELKKQQESLKGYNSPDFQNNIYNVEENQENLQNTETEHVDKNVLDEETLAKKEAVINDIAELLETDRKKVENGKFNLFGYGINLIDFKDSIHKSNSIPELQKKKDKLIEEQRLLKRIVSNIKSIPWEIMKSDSIIFNISLKGFDGIEKSVDKVIDLLKQRIQDLEDVTIPEDETGDEGEKGDISRDNIIQNENSETSETPEQQYSIQDLKKAYEKIIQKIKEKDEENKIILDDGTIVVIDFQLDKPITFTFPDGSTIVENTSEEIIIFKTKDGEEYKESLLKGLFGNGQFLNKYRNSLINKSSENSDEYIYKLPGGAIVTIDAFMNKAKISIPGDLEEEVDIKLIDNPKFHELSKEAQNAIEGYVYFSDDFEGQIKNAIEKIDIQGNTRTFIFKKGRFEYKAEGKAGGKMEFYEANFLGKFARKNDRVEEDFGNRRTRTYIFAKTGETFKEYINDDDYEKFYSENNGNQTDSPTSITEDDLKMFFADMPTQKELDEIMASTTGGKELFKKYPILNIVQKEEIDGRIFFFSNIILNKDRKFVLAFTKRNNEYKPLFLYFSKSGGNWHSAPAILPKGFSKGEHFDLSYENGTIVTREINDVISELSEKKLDKGSYEDIFKAQVLKGDLYSSDKDLNEELRAEFMNNDLYKKDENDKNQYNQWNKALLNPEEVVMEYFMDLNGGSPDIMGRMNYKTLSSKFTEYYNVIQNYISDPKLKETRESKHIYLGDTIIYSYEVNYQSTPESQPQKLIIEYAHTKKDPNLVWVENAVFADSKTNSYGFHSHQMNLKFLAHKPLEYKHQISEGIPHKNINGSIYLDIREGLQSHPLVRYYTEKLRK